jgi:hypothetical protein
MMKPFIGWTYRDLDVCFLGGRFEGCLRDFEVMPTR